MNAMFANGYALLIGVGQSAYPKWSLPVTVKDMQALRAVLTDPALCGYPDDPNHIRLLHDAGAKRQAILDGRAVFTSSLDGQQSWVRPDGTLRLYTYHLIEALQGAGNQPGDTTVRVSNLMAHLGKALPASAQAMGQEQTPFFDAATEDFPVASVLGGQGLPQGGWAAAAAEMAQRIERPVQASGERSVAAGGNMNNSVITTGDRNVVQRGKYNVQIGQATVVMFSEGGQVTQHFGEKTSGG